MKFFKTIGKTVVATGVVTVAGVSTAVAGIDLTGVAVDTADTFSVAAIVVTGIAAIWGIKKVVKLLNRS
jgi:riboflavin synthase alpha subunit